MAGGAWTGGLAFGGGVPWAMFSKSTLLGCQDMILVGGVPPFSCWRFLEGLNAMNGAPPKVLGPEGCGLDGATGGACSRSFLEIGKSALEKFNSGSQDFIVATGPPIGMATCERESVQ